MDILSGSERLLGMSNKAWARHANPWSVYTRAWGAPLVFLAVWSVYWIGRYAAAAITAAVLWAWINPRLFPPPKHADSWTAKGVLGEGAFLNREKVPIPKGHSRAAMVTTLFSALFFAIAVHGFIDRQFWTAFGGYHGAVLAKIWFVDRKVWLWENMRDAHPAYQAWANAKWDAAFDK